MIPGSNILNMALSAISSQTVGYHAFAARAPNDFRQYVATYAPVQALCGSFQPVPRRLYQQYGLDFQNIYYNFYVSKDLLDVQRDVSGDQITFNSQIYQVLSATDWAAIDGWTGVLCVQIGPINAG